MKVVWTEQALERIQEIEDFISQDSQDRAVRFTAKLIERGDALARFPNSGRRVPELASNDIREILEGQYRIVYRAASHKVEILTVFEGHRQFPLNDVTS